MEPALESAVDSLRGAHSQLADAPSWLVHPRIVAASGELEDRLERAVPAVESAHALARALPAFLGVDEQKRYFFGASNPAEMRGTGGFIGAFTVLTVSEGRLQFGEFSEIHDLPHLTGTVQPPSAEFAARYDRYGGAGSWLSLNVTPEFPEAARAYVNLYEATGAGPPLDGMIVTDPFAMAALVRVTGPVDVPHAGTLDADDLVEYVTNTAYADFDDRVERKEVLGTVAAAALTTFLEHGDGEPAEAMEALGAAVEGGHILLYSTDAETQAHLEQAGLSGALPEDPGDLVMPVLNSSSNAKTDYYLEIDATYDVTLLEGGAARGLLSVEMHNGAPTRGQPKYVIGPNRPGLQAGDNRFVFFSYCGLGCEITGVDRDGAIPDRTSIEEEHGLGVSVVPVVEMPSGTDTVISVKWDVPGVWSSKDGVLTYILTTRLQPFVQAPSMTVRVRIPHGTRPSAVPDGAVEEGDRLVFTVQDVGIRRHVLEFVSR